MSSKKNKLNLLIDQFDLAVKSIKDDVEIESFRKRLVEFEQSNQIYCANLKQSLEQAQIQLDNKNSALHVTSRMLEELSLIKKQLFTRIGEVENKFFHPIRDMLIDASLEVEDPLKEKLVKINTHLNQWEETFEPLFSMFFSEHIFKSKKILLADLIKKQRILSKIAMSGTGANLDTVDSLEEGLEKADENIYDIVCVTLPLMDIAVAARKKNPDVQIVLMTESQSHDQLEPLRNYSFICNIIARQEDNRAFTIKSLSTTIFKLLTHDLFGMEKYLNWAVKINEYAITGSLMRNDLIDHLQAYMEEMGVRRNIQMRCSMVADELLMNAVFDAPVDENGKSLYNHRSRKVPVELKKEHYGLFRFACDGLLFAISVIDPFGEFDRNTILKYLESCRAGQADQFNKQLGKGGGGRGLFLIIESSDLVIFNVKKGQRTEVTAIFDMDNITSQRNKAFHYFFQ